MVGILVSAVDTRQFEKGALLDTNCEPAEEVPEKG